jgi:hypothetical protein
MHHCACFSIAPAKFPPPSLYHLASTTLRRIRHILTPSHCSDRRCHPPWPRQRGRHRAQGADGQAVLRACPNLYPSHLPNPIPASDDIYLSALPTLVIDDWLYLNNTTEASIPALAHLACTRRPHPLHSLSRSTTRRPSSFSASRPPSAVARGACTHLS